MGNQSAECGNGKYLPTYALRPVWCEAGSAGSTGVCPGLDSSQSSRTHAKCPAPAAQSNAVAPWRSLINFGSQPSVPSVPSPSSKRRNVRKSPFLAASKPGSESASTLPEDTKFASVSGSPFRAAKSPAAKSRGARVGFGTKQGVLVPVVFSSAASTRVSSLPLINTS